MTKDAISRRAILDSLARCRDYHRRAHSAQTSFERTDAHDALDRALPEFFDQVGRLTVALSAADDRISDLEAALKRERAAMLDIKRQLGGIP